MRKLIKNKTGYILAGAILIGGLAGYIGDLGVVRAAETSDTAETVRTSVTDISGTVVNAANAVETEQSLMYGIGSTSKVVTAAAVMMLSDRGLIDLDTPLTTYIPEFEMADARYVQITPRMLLDHSSGIPGGTLNDAMLLGDNDTSNHDQLLKRLKSQRLKADPGEFAVYCNDGFTLAEILVERVSGKTFTQYIDEEMAAPLGIKWFQTPQSKGVSDHLAPIYDAVAGRELPPENANVIGSGGIYATAEDLCRFSEIFMNGRSSEKALLSDRSLKEMEDNRYGREMNPNGRDTTLAFGLGWDSVDTYPYSGYGVKALVKGGDTNFYHASLTVLPEENISCAVLTSGGNSTINQLAVQEIVMTYLDEIGRIERDEKAEDGGIWTVTQESREGLSPEEAKAYRKGMRNRSGWYAGSDMLKVDISENGSMALTSAASGKKVKQAYQYSDAGYFSSDNGDYINSSGRLTRGSNGQIGSTKLEFITGNNGKEYLMAESRETYPGLGTTAVYVPVGEKLVPETPDGRPDEATRAAWQNISGREFYLVSEKYTSSMYLTRFVVTPFLPEGLEGYLSFKDLELKMARLSTPEIAEFFQQVPGQAGRDLNDYKLDGEGGRKYLSSASGKYLSAEAVEPLPTSEIVITIGENGETVWFSTDDSQNAPVVFEIMDKGEGAWFVYDHTGRDMKCVSSSWTLEEGRHFFLPRDGRVAFAGEPGTQIRVRYVE